MCLLRLVGYKFWRVAMLYKGKNIIYESEIVMNIYMFSGTI